MRFSVIFCLLTSSLMAQSYLSYNTGLAHKFVHYAKERRPFILEALKKEKADVICLQEVWESADRRKVIRSVKKKYPYSFHTQTKQKRTDKAPSCRRKDLFGEDKFVSCMTDSCKDLQGDEHTDCIINKCRRQLQDLRDNKPQCAQSLMAQVGKKPAKAILNVLNPLVPAGMYAYKGSDGLMLLSKRPMKNISIIDLSNISTLNRRRAIVATVNGKTIACTHLSADLENSAPYAGDFSSWKAEHRAQSKKIIKESLKKKVSILLGDFNCSFSDSSNDIEGELESNCKLFTDAGFKDPLATMAGSCSYCTSNNLNNPDDANSLIDHIFVKSYKTKRALINYTEKVSLKNGVRTNLSDHFGVFIELR